MGGFRTKVMGASEGTWWGFATLERNSSFIYMWHGSFISVTLLVPVLLAHSQDVMIAYSKHTHTQMISVFLCLLSLSVFLSHLLTRTHTHTHTCTQASMAEESCLSFIISSFLSQNSHSLCFLCMARVWQIVEHFLNRSLFVNTEGSFRIFRRRFPKM